MGWRMGEEEGVGTFAPFYTGGDDGSGVSGAEDAAVEEGEEGRTGSVP